MGDDGRLNVLQFICHDLGRELCCYGDGSIVSPNIDALAERGVRFTRHFGASTPCSPARACQMTGRYAHSNGLIGLVNRGWDMPAAERTIVDYLNEAGYETYHFGLQHERKDPRANRYTHEHAGPSRARQCCPQLLEFLGSRRARGGPWYANIGTFEVHLSFDQPEYTFADPAEVNVPPYLPDNADVRLELSRFHGAIRYMDEWVGRIADALESAGLAERTVFVFTTDHGSAFPRAKSTLYDVGIGTALIVRFPRQLGVAPGLCNRLVSSIDVLPTLLEMLALPAGPDVQGRSFWPALIGRPCAENTEIFAEKSFHDCYDPIRCIRTERYKYIRNFEPDKVPAFALPADIRNSIASNELRPDAADPRAPEELYDLAADPFESTNLAGEPACQAVRADLAAHLAAWMQQTGDFLPGPMPAAPPEQPLDAFGEG